MTFFLRLQTGEYAIGMGYLRSHVAARLWVATLVRSPWIGHDLASEDVERVTTHGGYAWVGTDTLGREVRVEAIRLATAGGHVPVEAQGKMPFVQPSDRSRF